MRVLAIETATQACSVALREGDELLGHSHEVIGRGHAERLVPAIAALPGKGRADRVLVSLGPGSFTGVRIGLATARALGLAWGAEVLGYSTPALVAALARADSAPVSVCMNAGHGEFFVQNFDADGLPEDDARSLAPEQAAQACRHPRIAGDRAQNIGTGEAVDLLPDARGVAMLRAENLFTDLAPIYGRGPDARLPG